jgi:transcriptional regulator with XRE-family HTH domain
MIDSFFGKMVPAEDIADLLERRRRARGLAWTEVAERAELAESRIYDQLHRSRSGRPTPEVLHKISKPLALPGNTLLLATWGTGDDATDAMGTLLKVTPPEDKLTMRSRRRRGKAGPRPAGSGPGAGGTAPRGANTPRSEHWDRVLDVAERRDKSAWEVFGRLYAADAEITADADGRLRVVAGRMDASAYAKLRKKAMLPIKVIIKQILGEARAGAR